MPSLVEVSALFVMAPGGITRRFPESLGAAFLRTVLRRAGIASQQYIPDRNPSLRGFGEFLREVSPRLLGFTVYESNLTVSRAMVEAARDALPDAVVLAGGPNATFTPGETLDLVGADLCMRGAGEGTIVTLADRILGAESPAARLCELLGDVPNLVLRARGGPHHTPLGDLASFPAAYFRTLDDIPSPYRDGVVSTPDVGYVTARGCNQSCTYCSFAAVSGRRVAFHGVERVLDDLEALEALAARAGHAAPIDILDDAFTLVPERARRICEGILERGIRLRLRCETRGDRVTPDLLRLMRRAGFVDIAFGLESAVPRVLRTIGKVRPPDAVGDPGLEAEREYLARLRDAVDTARSCGLSASVSVIGGLPGETPDDFRTTLDFVSSLGVPYAHNVLSLFPGTSLHERRHAFGLDAFRERHTEIWRTAHAFPALAERPRAGSTLHTWRWNAAESVASALCGRPGAFGAGEGSVWAVVLHGCRRTRRLAAWLRRHLAIGGAVVVFEGARKAVSKWRAFLTRSNVPFSELTCLVPAAGEPGASFAALGSIGEHLVRLDRDYTVAAAEEPVRTDEVGDCRMAAWIASAPAARVTTRGKGDAPLVGPGLQIGDSCRLGIAAPRCAAPNVLHVDRSGNVRACWHGPVLEVVGAARQRPALRAAPARCPLGLPESASPEAVSSIWNVDLASQLSWLFPRGHAALEKPEPAGAGRSIT